MALVRIDPHAHLYDSHPVRVWVEAALRNLCVASGVSGLVVIVDRIGQDSFARLRREVPHFGTWSEGHDNERGGAITLSGEVAYQGQVVRVLRGVQYITCEKLEVLGLGVCRTIDDGMSCEHTIEQVRASGGVPCLPWAPGKWLGNRGAVVLDMLKRYSPRDLVVGDISIRSRVGPPSIILRRAYEAGFLVVPGSDPLPRLADAELVGSYGIELATAQELRAQEAPACIRTLLRIPSDELRIWGTPNRPLRALRRFIASV